MVRRRAAALNTYFTASHDVHTVHYWTFEHTGSTLWAIVIVL